MSKVKPTTKEQLVHYLLQNISLGTYDKRFLNNLQQIQFVQRRPATSNQAELLDKITLRYFKQLKRKEIDANEMVKLPWSMEPIDSVPEYTDAFCTIKDDIIEVRTPYKKDFVTDIKKSDIFLNWNRENKTWSGVYCEHILKHFIDCLDKHFQVIRYCDKTVEIINSFAEYEEATCWNPTLKLVNGNLLIAGINNALNEATKDIPLTISPETFAKLSMHGVKIDNDLINDDPLFKFATETSTVRKYNEIANIVSELKSLGCDLIVISETHLNGAKVIPNLIEECVRHDIPYFLKSKNARLTEDTKKFKYPVIINTGLWSNLSRGSIYAAKVVNLANSNPITIK